MRGSIGGRVGGELLGRGTAIVRPVDGCRGHNILWQFVPVWDYSDAERMLATTSLAPLLVNLQSMTSKPSAGGGSKDCVTWKVEEAVHNFVRADKVTTNSFTD